MGTGLLLSIMSLVLCAAGMLEAQDGEAGAHQAEDSAVAVAAGTISVDMGSQHEGVMEGTGAEAPVAAEALVASAPRRLPGVTRDDALLEARACAHESTFRGGRGGTFDCGAQTQVIQTRRREGETFSHALLRTMPRFAAHTTSRAWVHALPAGPLHDDPPGWPYEYPARHDSDAWHSVYLRVSDFMLGREPLPCAAPPEHWFGRRADHDQLAARLASGRWVEADCNPGGAPQTQTLNAYLTRVSAPVSP